MGKDGLKTLGNKRKVDQLRKEADQLRVKVKLKKLDLKKLKLIN